MPKTVGRQKHRKLRGLETVVVVLILVIIGVVAAVMLYTLFISKWFTPAAALDISLDPSTLLVGKVGTVVVTVFTGASGAKDPVIEILDADTGQTAAQCTITSSPPFGSDVYTSGDKITARCIATTQFYRGKTYVVQVTVTDAATGSKFVKSFKVVAQ
jgi:hypothetical protein